MSDKKKRSMAGLPWIAAMAFFMQALDATILNTALPAIAHSLNRSPLAMQSAIISYTLTVAMLIPVSGWLADRFGTRRIFTLAVSLFTLGSLACALSNSLPQLVVFRVIQGIGGAMMMPVARLALLRAYPRNELLPVLNFVAMPGLVGPILGPVSWRRAGHLGNLALDIFNQYPHRYCGPSLRAQTYAQFHHRTTQIRYHWLFAVWPQPCSLLKRNRAIRGKDCRQLDCLDGNCHQHRVTASLYSPCTTHAKPINFIRFI